MKEQGYTFFDRVILFILGLIVYAMGFFFVYGLIVVFELSLWWLVPFVPFFIALAKEIFFVVVGDKPQCVCADSDPNLNPDTEFDSFRVRHHDYMRGYYRSDSDDD